MCDQRLAVQAGDGLNRRFCERDGTFCLLGEDTRGRVIHLHLCWQHAQMSGGAID